MVVVAVVVIREFWWLSRVRVNDIPGTRVLDKPIVLEMIEYY